jgi:hypothetical protein
MATFLVANDQLPHSGLLAKHMGYTSMTSSQQIYHQLERKGVIERNEAGGWKRGPSWSMVAE